MGTGNHSAGEALLDIRDLRVSFGSGGARTEAVKGISFSIAAGEIVGLVGESGSGKSVTSLSLMQLISAPGRIDGGRLIFHEETGSRDLLQLPPEDIRRYRGDRISMIFQEPMSSLNPVFTCGRQVTEAIRQHRRVSASDARREAAALFEKVRLPDPEGMLDRYPHQLSGGQKQRVMIAMAICGHPRLLIADEPTTALDVTVQKTILELLRELQRSEGMSVLFITHDLGVVAEIADRVLVMYRGQLVEEGSVDDIFQRPQHPYTRGLLACRPPLGEKLRRLPVVADFMEEKQGSVRSRETDVAAVLQSLRTDPAESQRRLEHLQRQEPIVRVRDLVTRFAARHSLGRTRGWVTAVDRVSFDLFPGETLGLVGESGSGKTTLGRSLLQLVRPEAGQVLYRNRDLCRMPARELRRWRRHMQIVFQDPYSSLNPRMTVGEAIMEPMRVHRLFGHDTGRREKAYELLQKVNLDPAHFRRYPHEFSGGQRQRIGLARALALEPDLVVCDESVSALDVSVQAQVLNLLLKLREEMGFSCIFISHDLSVVQFLCDRIMVMYQGQIEETGPAATVCQAPRSAFTRRLIDAIPGRRAPR